MARADPSHPNHPRPLPLPVSHCLPLSPPVSPTRTCASILRRSRCLSCFTVRGMFCAARDRSRDPGTKKMWVWSQPARQLRPTRTRARVRAARRGGWSATHLLLEEAAEGADAVAKGLGLRPVADGRAKRATRSPTVHGRGKGPGRALGSRGKVAAPPRRRRRETWPARSLDTRGARWPTRAR